MIHRRLIVLFAIVASTLLAGAAAAEWTKEHEHWYVIDIAGGTAGWMREARFVEGEQYRSETEYSMRIGRGGRTIEVKMQSRFLETAEGRPISLEVLSKQGAMGVESVWTFHDDRIESVTKQGERELRSTLPAPEGAWLTPRAIDLFVRERMAAGASVIEYRTITGEQGVEPVTITQTRDGEGEAEHEGRTIPVTLWKITTSALPTAATAQLSRDGHLISESVSLPGMGEMRTRIATRREAMAAGAGPAPELMVSLFVPVDPPIDRPRSAVRATYRVRAIEGDLPPLPEAASQRGPDVDSEGRSALVHLDIEAPLPATETELANPEYLAPSPMCDVTDEMIMKLADRAVKDVADDPAARAEALRAFVHRFIRSKNLDTAFATASEVARQRRGDCSEHGVLLCALLRAQKIPARVAAGLVYADAIAGKRAVFGWHMWTQALIDGRWVDLDATLNVPYDAAHLLTATSSLGESSGIAELAGMIVMMGNLEIEVVDVDYR